MQDEINRLKGEQGNPTFKSQGPRPGGTNYASEQERRQPKTWQQGTKLDQIRIERVERRQVAPATLPDDAIYQGIEMVTVQDLILCTDTVQFELELWYSPAQRRRYRAPLPAGYEGECGPGSKTLALALGSGAILRQAQDQPGEAVGAVAASGPEDVQRLVGDIPQWCWSHGTAGWDPSSGPGSGKRSLWPRTGPRPSGRSAARC